MSTSQANQSMGREPATVRIAMWSARHRWPVAALWFVCTIGLLVISISMGGINTAEVSDNPNEQRLEATEALDVFNAGGKNDPSEQFLVIIEGGTGAAADPAFQAAVGDVVGRLRASTAQIDGTATPSFDQLVNPFEAPPQAGLISADGTTVRIAARTPGDSTRVIALLEPVRPIMDASRSTW